MAATKIKAFYDLTTGAVTRWVFRDGPQEDDDYSAHPPGPNEGTLDIPPGQAKDLFLIQDFTNKKTGLNPTLQPYAIVELDGTISAIVNAYAPPPISHLQEAVVANDPNAMIGGKHIGGIFVPLPPGTPNPNWPRASQIGISLKP